jgi:hypothetical protein
MKSQMSRKTRLERRGEAKQSEDRKEDEMKKGNDIHVYIGCIHS